MALGKMCLMCLGNLSLLPMPKSLGSHVYAALYWCQMNINIHLQ